MIHIKELIHDYVRHDENGNVEETVRAIDGVDMDAKPGEFIAILGHNGCGKSTLAKHLNALLYPTEGTVLVDGMDTREEDRLWDIRQRAGMVFQNPDNQIIGQVVEEDVGFGPENMGIPTEQIWERVEESLKTVGMYELRKKSPNRLSGGQKQRVSIAGVIAMHPKCIILDEPTAMLDPSGRKEVIRAARALNDVEQITIILITHYMEEAIYADRIFVMDSGKVVMNGSPREIFSRVEELQKIHLDVPQVTLLAEELQKRGLSLPDGILTGDELVQELKKEGIREEALAICAEEKKKSLQVETVRQEETENVDWNEKAASSGTGIRVEDICYTYEKGTAMAVNALNHITTEIPKGQFIGLIGHTGSGKSTFVQTLNGLYKTTSGHIYFDGTDIDSENYDRKQLRARVGLVFQYPEHQLFEETVLKDVMFGPGNLGLSEEECRTRAVEALQNVRLEEKYYSASPFDLSGGQKRRAAIAGVLAMHPEFLILDEPTAGLDPQGRDEILELCRQMHEELGITILLVSHSMEDVARFVDRIMVMNDGNIMLDGRPEEVFAHVSELEAVGLAAPQMTYILNQLQAEGLRLSPDALKVETAADHILEGLVRGWADESEAVE